MSPCLPQDEIDRRVAQAAKTLDLEKLLDRKPKALSGGQRQRVAMGRAIVRDPKVLLLDEPLSNLDAKLRGQMRVEISRLHERLGATMIYVTHDQTEAMTLGDRIVVMSDGEVQQIDTPQYLYDHPANKFVAGFIGSPQMNFLDGTVTEKNGKVAVRVGDTDIAIDPAKGKVLKDGGYMGKEVTIGVRPEDLYDTPEHLELYKDSKAKAKVAVRENLGAEIYLYTDFNEAQLTARVDPESKTQVGDEVELSFGEGQSGCPREPGCRDLPVHRLQRGTADSPCGSGIQNTGGRRGGTVLQPRQDPRIRHRNRQSHWVIPLSGSAQFPVRRFWNPSEASFCIPWATFRTFSGKPARNAAGFRTPRCWRLPGWTAPWSSADWPP